MGLQSEADILALVNQFEELTLPKERWTHSAHLTVAAVYVEAHGGEAVAWIRDGIQRLNAHFGVNQTATSGYHETLTIAWTRLISDHLANLPAETRLADRVASVIERFTDRSVILNYYSRDRIMSTEARYGWVAPDLAELPDG